MHGEKVQFLTECVFFWDTVFRAKGWKQMKDGTFEENLTGYEFDENDDFEVSRVPIPSEMPMAFDSSALPNSVKRSSAVEALIQQNDDLMSRLSVSLRRVSDLEDQVNHHQSEGHQYKSRYENLRDQVLVLKEKIKILSDRRNAEDADVNGLKEQIQLLEIRYAELYEASQKKETRLLDQAANAQKTIGRLTRYRNRVRRAIDAIRSDAKTLRVHSAALSKRVEKSEITIEDLRKNILESTDYIREQAKIHEDQVQALTTGYETDLAAKNTEISELRSLANELNAKKAQFENATDKAIQLENELVLRDRKFDEYRMQSATELSDMQKTLARFRNETKELALQLELTQNDLQTQSQKSAVLNEENFKLVEQVENLQALWNDQNSKVEKLQTQNISLQKLNQELSMTINQYRKDLRDLREKMDANHISTKTMAQTTTKTSTDAVEINTNDQNTSPKLVDKIDQALAQMQIGN